MFDFFIKNPISIDEIIEFLASALGCASNKILATTFEKLNDPNFPDNDLNEICCLCVYSKIDGNASWLVNLYRISATDDEIRDKIIAVSQLKHIACYIPNDDLNGYLLTGESESPIQVYEDEDIEEENTYVFNQLISNS